MCILVCLPSWAKTIYHLSCSVTLNLIFPRWSFSLNLELCWLPVIPSDLSFSTPHISGNTSVWVLEFRYSCLQSKNSYLLSHLPHSSLISYIKWIIEYVVFGDWLLSLNKAFGRLIYVTTQIRSYHECAQHHSTGWGSGLNRKGENSWALLFISHCFLAIDTISPSLAAPQSPASPPSLAAPSWDAVHLNSETKQTLPP